MRLLDKYVLKQYLKTFLNIEMAFFVLFIVIDLFDRGPRLMRNGANTYNMVLYFVMRIPYLTVMTAPIAVLLSGLFLMSGLSKYHESIAIRAAGISIFRMTLPVMLFCMLFSGFMLWFADTILPKAQTYQDYIYHVKIKKGKISDVKMRSNISYKGNNNTLYNIGFFDGYKNLLRDIEITKFNPETGLMQKRIKASQAIWKQNKWEFEKGGVFYFDEKGKNYKSDFFETTFLDSIEVKPIDFVRSAKKPMQMNYSELKNYIKRLKRIGEKTSQYEVDLFNKISFPFANFVIILFCVPLASTSVRSKSRGIIFLMGLIITFVYMSAMRISISLGYSGAYSPLTAAWLPHIIFFALGIYFVVKAEV